MTTRSCLEEVQGWGAEGTGGADSVSVTQHFLHLVKPGREGGFQKDLGKGSKSWPTCWQGPGLPERMSSFNHGGIPSCGGKVTVPGKVDQGRMT